MVKVVAFILILFWAQLFAQHRGIWIVRNSLNTVQDLQRLEQIDQKIGLTDVYLQVRALGRNVYERTAKDRLSLEEIVRFCHARQIRIHGWINVLYVWSGKQPPTVKSHPFLEYEHLMTDAQNERLTLPQLRQKGIEGYFLDAGAFVNSGQIENLIKQLLIEKQFDGIHLDYLRYPGHGVIFSGYLRTKFMKKYFVDPLVFFNNLLPQLKGQYRYQNFLLNELNNYVENLRNIVKSLDETCVLSVAVKPNLELARTNFYQDWLTWLQKSSCDYVLIMNYSPDDFEFNKNLVGAENTAFSRKIVCGIGAYYLNQKRLEQRINSVEKSKLKGYALFSFTTIKEQPEILSLVNGKN